MAVYKRSIADEDDNTEPTIQKCITIRFQIPSMDCFATVTLCDDEYTMDENGVVTINSPKTVYCTGFPTIPIVILAQTTFPTFKRDKYTTQGGIVNPYTTNGRVDAVVGLSITTSGGSPMSVNATLQGGTITVTSRQDLMPKLAEWHIYGNEQQGRFVTRKPETEPCYYLGGVTNDVANLNFFRILDKKEYELKDHLGNVRVAIGDMKLPENEATSTRGVPPFVTDEKAVNDYYPFGMTIADRSYSTSGYRYGYNGKENDNEVKGTGNSIDYGARIYDPRVTRFLSQDPLKDKFAGISPYLYAGDSPIKFIDVDGKHLGVTLLYTEGSLGGGVGVGMLNYNTVEGTAYDEIGTTFFRMSKMNYFVNTIEEPMKTGRVPDMVLGADASMGIGMTQNWSANLFSDVLSDKTINGTKEGVKFKGELGVGVNVGASWNSFTIGFALGFGAKFSMVDNKLDKAISITYKEKDKLKVSGLVSSAVKVDNIKFNDQTNQFNGSLFGIDEKGKLYNTGIKLTSGSTRDADGNIVSNQVWKSTDYIKEEKNTKNGD